MATRLQVFQCQKCGHIVMVFAEGQGTLTCCNEPMRQLNENTTDAATEKHVPVIEKTATGYKVKVGSVPHPMQDDHFIQWVELIAGDTLCCQFLNPSAAPEADFNVDAEDVYAREYCNLHGYWKG